MMFCEAHEKRKKTKKEFKKQSCKNMIKETFCAKKNHTKRKVTKNEFFFEDKKIEERDFHSSAKMTGSDKYQKKREQKKGQKKTKDIQKGKSAKKS